MKKTLLSVAAGAALLMNSSAFSQNSEKNLLLSAWLQGSQQVPVVTTSASGLAGLTLNASKDTLFVNISFHGLSSPLTGIHIHDGSEGHNGAVVVDLTSFVKNNHISSFVTGPTLTSALIGKVLRGGTYVNLHTTLHPDGEIRGQIKLEKEWGFTGKLSGAQQVPAISTVATGLGLFKLSKDQSKIKITVVADGLSGPITGAHFHKGAAGETGAVVKDLTSLISGNTIIGTVDSSSVLNDLLAGNIYINLHTTAHPDGEIRAQLIKEKYLIFNALVNGNQEVPALTNTAKGVFSAKLSHTLDTLWYDAVLTGLSSIPTGAHLHKGAKGSNGPVVVDLTSGISGNTVSGVYTGTSLTTDLINNLLTENIYFNAHTTANPDGELRGQLKAHARVGYSATLSGTQQVPFNSSKGTGTAIVSIARDTTELYYQVLVTGLSSKITGAHFHSGPIGKNGPVISDLTSSFAKVDTIDQAAGFILNPNRKLFDKDSVYINLHNVPFPDGEIRGQFLNGGKAEIVTAVMNADLTNITGFNLSPNPATDVVNISLSSNFSGTGKISILDVMGKEVSSQNVQISSSGSSITLNVGNLSNGVYLVQIQSGNSSIIKRITKN